MVCWLQQQQRLPAAGGTKLPVVLLFSSLSLQQQQQLATLSTVQQQGMAASVKAQGLSCCMALLMMLTWTQSLAWVQDLRAQGLRVQCLMRSQGLSRQGPRRSGSCCRSLVTLHFCCLLMIC
jgi:hypothetical protein